jgi:hypothetical protein
VNLVKKTVMRLVASLVPYASNSRTHTPAQIDLIARSIEAFGFTNPILVDGENGIVAGHARLKAAQKIGLTEVPTIELSWLTPAEKQAYIIADNQTAIAGSGWDAEVLRLELGDLTNEWLPDQRDPVELPVEIGLEDVGRREVTMCSPTRHDGTPGVFLLYQKGRDSRIFSGLMT